MNSRPIAQFQALMSAKTVTRSAFSPHVWLFLITLLLIVATNVYLVDRGISYREVIIGLGLLGGLGVLLVGPQGLRVGLVFFVATFALGYRTLSVNADLRVHPSELVILGLFGLLIIRRAVWRQHKIVFWLPIWFVLLVPFCLWGWHSIDSGTAKWESMFLEFKDVMLFVPLLVVSSNVITERKSWRPLFLAYYLAGVWVASMGLMEYLFPQVKSLMPGFVSDPLPYQTGEGFERAVFSFWGSSDAVYICVLAFPFATAVWDWWSATWTRILNLALIGIILGGVYISGHRNSWLMITVQFSVLLLVKKKYLLAGAVLIVLISGYQFVPIQARDRLYSAAELVSGQPLKYDTSGRKRLNRTTTSLSNSLEEPLGRGWAAAGWVHNDFLQITENLGVAAGVLFLGAFIFTLQRLARRVRAATLGGDQRISGTALLMSFTSAGMILTTEAALVLPQLILPIWFIWVCVEIWLRQPQVARQT